MPKFTIGSVEFPSKHAATAEIRRILRESELWAGLLSPAHDLIAALYDMHPRANRDSKPESFMVGINNFHGALTRGFHIVFADGTRDTFSYRPCLSPKNDSPSLIAAMRAAIMLSQREALQQVYWNIRPSLAKCWKCKELVPKEIAHVHHLHPKFRDIADHFISLIGMPRVENDDLGDVLADPTILNRWQHFHDAVAQRVVSCARCNAEDERMNGSDECAK